MTKLRYWLAFCLITATGMLSCRNNNNKTTTDNAAEDPLAANRDTSVNPADDFFEYANGGWIKKHPIPDAYSAYGIAYLVRDDLQLRLKAINEAAVNNPKDPIARKIAAFWKSGMDTANINRQGITALRQLTGNIDDIHDRASLLSAMALLHSVQVPVLLDIDVEQDAKNSDVMALYLSQGGLGLPNRDYYFDTDAQTTKIRNEYPRHISRMLQLAGADSLKALQAASAIMNIETQLARASRKLEALRDPYANYNKYKTATIKPQLSPEIDWDEWLSNMGIRDVDSVIVGQPEFLKAVNNLLKTVSWEDWKSYLKFHLLSSLAPYLSNDFVQEDFHFYSQMLSGVQQQKERWKQVLDAEEGAMGEALGRLFVQENFDAVAKKRYEDLVEKIREALKIRIQNLDWMSPDTKAKALDKLAGMRKKVGYPDKWKDFSEMNIAEQPYVLNIIAARHWWHNYEFSKLGKPVDREEWDMTPQTYNAYYNPLNNEIVLPAGIFTIPGKKDSELDDALVYGYAAASTIGHEITHGFDDEGRRYDAEGNLNNWWTPEDEAQFNRRAQVMVEQFNAFEPLPGKHINGQATLGENIADLGGVLLGWDAFTQTEQYKKGVPINGLSPAQRFFLGYSLGWLYDIREESLAQRLLTDVHSPAKYRVNGPFRNVPAFYETFQLKSGDGMYVPDSARVKIW